MLKPAKWYSYLGPVLIILLMVGSLQADLKIKKITKTKLAGTVGAILSAVSSTGKEQVEITYLKGHKMRVENGSEVTIIDFDKGVVVTLDPEKKQYTEISFEEMKTQLENAMKMGSQKSETMEQPEESNKEKEKWEVLFDVQKTGKHQEILGRKAEELVMVVTVKQKGVALEDSGGIVITTHNWFAEELPETKELMTLQKDMMEKMELSSLARSNVGAMGAILGQYPQAQAGLKKLQKEMESMGKFAVKTVTVIEIEEGKRQKTEKGNETSVEDLKNVSKMLGRFAKKFAKKSKEQSTRTKLMEIENEVTEIDTKPLANDLFVIPKGYVKRELEY